MKNNQIGDTKDNNFYDVSNDDSLDEFGNRHVEIDLQVKNDFTVDNVEKDIRIQRRIDGLKEEVEILTMEEKLRSEQPTPGLDIINLIMGTDGTDQPTRIPLQIGDPDYGWETENELNVEALALATAESVALATASGFTFAGRWIVDGACTSIVSFEKRMFVPGTLRRPGPGVRPMMTATKHVAPVELVGDIALVVETPTGTWTRRVTGKYSPQFGVNLIPESFLVEKLGCEIEYTAASGKTITTPETHKICLKKDGGVHFLERCEHLNVAMHTADTPAAPDTACTGLACAGLSLGNLDAKAYTGTAADGQARMAALHALFGHPGPEALIDTLNVYDLKLTAEELRELRKYSCRDGCAVAKHIRKSIPKEAKGAKPNAPGVKVSCDVVGKLPDGMGGKNYAWVFVDWYTRRPYIYPVSRKSDFLECFQQFLLDAGLWEHGQAHLQVLQTDTESTVFSGESKAFARKHGIRLRASPPGERAKNGLCERMWRHIKSRLIATLHGAGAPVKFWPHAITHVALQVAVGVTKATGGEAPWKREQHVEADVEVLLPQPWGTVGTVTKWKGKGALDTPGRVGVYVGNSARSQSVKVWCPDTNAIVEAYSFRADRNADGTWVTGNADVHDTFWGLQPDDMTEPEDNGRGQHVEVGVLEHTTAKPDQDDSGLGDSLDATATPPKKTMMAARKVAGARHGEAKPQTTTPWSFWGKRRLKQHCTENGIEVHGDTRTRAPYVQALRLKQQHGTMEETETRARGGEWVEQSDETIKYVEAELDEAEAGINQPPLSHVGAEVAVEMENRMPGNDDGDELAAAAREVVCDYHAKDIVPSGAVPAFCNFDQPLNMAMRFANGEPDADPAMFLQVAAKMDEHEQALLFTQLARSVTQAKKLDTWEPYLREAFEREMKKFQEHDVYYLVPMQSVGKSTLVDSFVNFTAVHGIDGSIEKMKARFLAKGYKQTEWKTFFDTSAPTPFDTSWRVAASVCAMQDWDVAMHDDVNTAFLVGGLREAVHIRFPPDMRTYDDGGGEMVGRLRKGMYGLKQSSRIFSDKVATVLQEKAGLQRCNFDPCV